MRGKVSSAWLLDVGIVYKSDALAGGRRRRYRRDIQGADERQRAPDRRVPPRRRTTGRRSTWSFRGRTGPSSVRLASLLPGRQRRRMTSRTPGRQPRPFAYLGARPVLSGLALASRQRVNPGQLGTTPSRPEAAAALSLPPHVRRGLGVDLLPGVPAASSVPLVAGVRAARILVALPARCRPSRCRHRAALAFGRRHVGCSLPAVPA